MFEAAKLRPVVIDESLTGLDTLLLAREMGYTGVALKACKGQSQTLLMAAAAQKYKMFRCVQDLTCPGAALVHSVGIAAHVPGTSARWRRMRASTCRRPTPAGRRNSPASSTCGTVGSDGCPRTRSWPLDRTKVVRKVIPVPINVKGG